MMTGILTLMSLMFQNQQQKNLPVKNLAKDEDDDFKIDDDFKDLGFDDLDGGGGLMMMMIFNKDSSAYD